MSLHHAVKGGDLATVPQLLGAGADVNMCDLVDSTSLGLLSWRNRNCSSTYRGRGQH